jgi:serine/threonine protein kinase
MKILHSPSPENIDKKIDLVTKLPSTVKRQLIDIFGIDVTEKILAEKSSLDYEDVLEEFESVLPGELVNRKIQESRMKKSSLLDSLQSLTKLAEERENTWEMEGDETYTEEALLTIKTLSNLRYDDSLFLGKGNAGHVFEAPGNKYCVKYLHNQKNQIFNISEEFTLLDQVGKISKIFEVLRTPRAHCVAKNINSTKNFFTMEKISGLTLAQIVSFPSKRKSTYPNFSTEKIIEILEDKILRDKLVRDLTLLHNSGVIHGDVHSRNIMMSEDGTIYLIDFGNAVIPVNVSTQATYDTIENVKEIDIKAFINSLDSTVAELKKQSLT